MRATLFIALLSLAAASPCVLGQHATGADVFSGEQAFQNACASCHGKTGNLVANVDLSRGVFRKPYSDAELTDVVLKGIAGTPMPATPGMSREQAVQIVAWLRSRATLQDATAGGDAARGKALFVGKGQCATCHRVHGEGSRLGPDLSRIGLLRSADHLATSLLEPDRVVQPTHRTYSVVTRSGQRVTGRLLNHDVYSVQLLDGNEQLRSFTKAELQDETFLPSPMPTARGLLTEQELADLVQYLLSLRASTKP